VQVEFSIGAEHGLACDGRMVALLGLHGLIRNDNCHRILPDEGISGQHRRRSRGFACCADCGNMRDVQLFVVPPTITNPVL
jgi:hypothetical protein